MPNTKKADAYSAAEMKEHRRRLTANERLEAGVCYDPARWPNEFFRCSETEQASARGEVSVSWDGTVVQDLASGKIELQDSTVTIRPDTTVVPVTHVAGTSGAVAPVGNVNVTTEGAHP